MNIDISEKEIEGVYAAIDIIETEIDSYGYDPDLSLAYSALMNIKEKASKSSKKSSV